MKNHFAWTVVVAALMVGLSGCDDVTTPQGILATAADKIQKNDFDGFEGLLLGQALRTYGTPQGFETLRALLQNRNVKISDPNLENETGDATDFVRIFSDSVVESSDLPLLDAMIDCHTVTPEPAPAPADPSLVPGTNCRIFEIRLDRVDQAVSNY